MASCLHQGQCPFWSISPCVKREPCRRNVCFHPPYLTSRLRSRAPRADRNARYLWSSRRKTTMPGPCRVLSRDSSQAAITIFQASTFRPTCSSDGKEHAVPNLITDCRAFESPGGRDSGRPVPARGVFRRVRRDQRNARRCVRVKVRNHPTSRCAVLMQCLGRMFTHFCTVGCRWCALGQLGLYHRGNHKVASRSCAIEPQHRLVSAKHDARACHSVPRCM